MERSRFYVKLRLSRWMQAIPGVDRREALYFLLADGLLNSGASSPLRLMSMRMLRVQARILACEQ